MLCEGQTLPISENEVLFQLIGTTYGGDGQETFNLPGLASRVPIHMGTGPDSTTYQIGETAGTESVTLTTQQIPNHTHAWLANTQTGTDSSPNGRVTDQTAGAIQLYIEEAPDSNLAANAISSVGGNQPHENTQPFLCINFIISLFGVFPSPT
jgi:microcystin-dependent protein